MYLEPSSEKELLAALTYCFENRIPVFPLGRGSNLIIPDDGVEGLVIRLTGPSWKRFERIDDKTINSRAAKQVFQVLWQEPSTNQDNTRVDAIIEKLGLKQVSDSGALNAFVDDVLAKNPDQVIQYKEGKTKVLGFLVGQVMKLSKGKANPGEVNKLLVEKLKE